jgi:hypothetical protein
VQVRNIARAVGRACAEGGSCTLMQLHKVTRPRAHYLTLHSFTRREQANPAYRGAAFSHDDDSRLALDALELLLRAHEHVYTLRPAFDKGSPALWAHSAVLRSRHPIEFAHANNAPPPPLQVTFKCSWLSPQPRLPAPTLAVPCQFLTPWPKAGI